MLGKGEIEMKIYEELQARGLIAQVTDEEEIRELINNGKLQISNADEILDNYR